MKLFSKRQTTPAEAGRPDRRAVVVGAGVAGTAAVAAHALQRAGVDAPAQPSASVASTEGAGYRLTPHVRRYYETTRA